MIVRFVAPADREAWDRLYAGYAAFYGVEQTPAMRDRLWGWLMDPAHGTEAMVAERDGALVGLAHVRPYARALAASTGGFLDDLFVDPAARGGGVGRALVAAAADLARSRGWSVLRWITAEDNGAARALYDRLATRTSWVTHEIAT